MIIVVRQRFDADIAIYAREMSYSGFPTYQFKEPIVWFGQKILYKVFGEPIYVFIFFDIFIGLLIYKALSNFQVRNYVYFSILVFFPVILGLQNIYRQWISVVLFLYAFSLMWKNSNPKKSFFLFIISILAHNSAILMSPIIFIFMRNRPQWLWVVILSLCVVLMALGAKLKSTATTGTDFSSAYVALLVFMVFLLIIIDAGKIKMIFADQYKLFFIMIVLALSSFYLISSSSSERLSMTCLIILYPIISKVIEERFMQPETIRFLFIIFGFIPMNIHPLSQFIR